MVAGLPRAERNPTYETPQLRDKWSRFLPEGERFYTNPVYQFVYYHMALRKSSLSDIISILEEILNERKTDDKTTN